MNNMATLVLTASDVRQYLTMEKCIAAVETAFALLGSGKAALPVALGVHVPGGGFHVKAGMLSLDRNYFAAKLNGNFPANPRLHDLPTIQGVVILADATNGRVLAVVDSVELTAKRTAAATAVAARYLAQPDASVAAIVGCGFQAFYQIEALAAVRPIEHVLAIDANPAQAEQFAQRVSHNLQIACRVSTIEDAAASAPHIWVTCSTSTEFILFPDHVCGGAFVAGVGVDNEDKRELAPELLAKSHVVADLADQCSRIGDLHHTYAAGMQPLSVAELADVVAGGQMLNQGRDRIYVFDSTGVGLQDVAACATLFEAAIEAGNEGNDVASVNFM